MTADSPCLKNPGPGSPEVDRSNGRPLEGIQALFFDVVGTCTDWHQSLFPALMIDLPNLEDIEVCRLLKEWRSQNLQEIQSHVQSRLPEQDMDFHHRRVLDRILLDRGITVSQITRDNLVHRWHHQVAWPDTIRAMKRLRKSFIIVAVAEGTVRYNIDIAKSSGLSFDAVFRVEIAGSLGVDQTGMFLPLVDELGLDPSQCVRVASIARDLRVAKTCGLRTVYIRRKGEDEDEDLDLVRRDVDLYLEPGRGGVGGHLGELASILAADTHLPYTPYTCCSEKRKSVGEPRDSAC
ncbi:hypothetical protein MMC19_003917 [Ptychographa xylographoides]|nr:hypothetical protein [Ptychographa xylographoides]